MGTKCINLGPITSCLSRDSGWFRWRRKKGFSYKNTKVKGHTFSERYGYVKTLKIGKWSFRLLK